MYTKFFISTAVPKEDLNLFMRFLKNKKMIKEFMDALTHATDISYGSYRNFFADNDIPVKTSTNIVSDAFPWEMSGESVIDWAKLEMEWRTLIKRKYKKRCKRTWKKGFLNY